MLAVMPIKSGLRSYGGLPVKQPRSSNLELYRIICMLMIVAHHYVANSGLSGADGPLVAHPTAANSLYLGKQSFRSSHEILEYA